MTIKPKVSLAFIKEENPSDKVTTGNSIINGLTTYADKFPDLPISIKDFSDLNKQLSEEKTAADTGLFSAKKALTNTLKKWDDAARQLCNYVNGIANGNEQTIAEAGMKSTKNETTPTHEPGADKEITITPERAKGALTVKSNIEGATATVVIAATGGANIKRDHNSLVITVGEETITLIVDTHHTLHFENLPSGVPVSIYTYGVNLAGPGPLSSGGDATPQ